MVVGMTVRHARVMQVAAGGAVTWRSDDVSTEEPLEIRLGDVSLSVTMRTPGDDFDLVAGFLVTAGIVDVAGDPLRVSPALLLGLPAVQRSAQRQFSRTGGLHAAALFDGEGALLCLR